MSSDSKKEGHESAAGNARGPKGNGDGRSDYSRYAPYLSLGAEIAAGVTVPVLIGYWLDQWFDTSPWLLLVGILAGMGNIFLLIYRLYKDLG